MEVTGKQWKDKVNDKRRYIAQVFTNNPSWTLKQVMQFTKSDYTTVKKIRNDLSFQG